MKSSTKSVNVKPILEFIESRKNGRVVLATYADVSTSTIENIIRGSVPRPITRKLISRLLKMKESELFPEEEG